MHTVVIVALPDVILFDLSTPVNVFMSVVLPTGERGYRVVVCSEDAAVTAGPLGITTDRRLDALAEADTIVVPGRSNVEATAPAALIDADVLYVDQGRVLTSAGASAGLDLCLHMVARDYGTTVAAHAARLAVAPLHRSGGQAQFIVRNRPLSGTIGLRQHLEPVLAWIEREAHRDLSLREIADYAAVSIRTLNRRFQLETGQTPMQWVTGVRVRHAQQLLESTGLGVESIGRRVGFASSANFRDQFRRLSGVSPREYRDTFRDQLAG